MRKLHETDDYNDYLNGVDPVIEKYPVKITDYYLSLIREKGDAIWKQCMPDIREITEGQGLEDPLEEERDSPLPGVVHRYPDRLLLLISNNCAVNCRFCTRKRQAAAPFAITEDKFEAVLDYLKSNSQIRDVLLSGGDPLMLPIDKLEYFLRKLHEIDTIHFLRIGTRLPCVYPMGVTEKLCEMLKKYHPLYINVHFNHPYEITAESTRACNMLADAGIPLGNQSVLLKGVNNEPEVMKRLVRKLLKIRVKPYYLYIPDLVKGTHHFRPTLEEGLNIIACIRGWTSGMAVPHLIIDIQGGGGKIPLLPEYLVSKQGNTYLFRNYQGQLFSYKDPAEPAGQMHMDLLSKIQNNPAHEIHEKQ